MASRARSDATASVLLRTTSELVTLPELAEETPCHGLVVPTDATTALSPRLLRLEALQLYQALAARLAEGTLEDEALEAGRRWAFDLAAREWARRGTVDGLALSLARLVPIPGPAGAPWGTAAQWLQAPSDARPALPEGWSVPEVAQEALPVAVDARAWLRQRLDDAFPDLNVVVFLTNRDGRTPVRLVPEQSHRNAITLMFDREHPLVARAASGERTAREVVLLEAARVAVRHNRWIGQSAALLSAHQALLASREG